jgi:hypothetical protein
LILKFFKNPADHVNTDAVAFAQYIGHAEITGKIIYGIMNHCRFHAAGLMLPVLGEIRDMGGDK